jgi:hypothetical protein
MKKILLFLAFITVTVSGCYYDIEEDLYPQQAVACDTANVTYNLSVQPLLQSRCYSCHTGSAPAGNVHLGTYAGVKTYADNGKLIGVISHSPGFTSMPMGGNKLSSCEILTIQTWINKGTLEN